MCTNRFKSIFSKKPNPSPATAHSENKMSLNPDDGIKQLKSFMDSQVSISEFIIAIKKNDVKKFFELLSYVDVNKTFNYNSDREQVLNETLLHIAVKYGSPKLLKSLLENCDPELVNVQTKYGQKPAITAYELALGFQIEGLDITCAQVFGEYFKAKKNNLSLRASR